MAVITKECILGTPIFPLLVPPTNEMLQPIICGWGLFRYGVASLFTTIHVTLIQSTVHGV